MQLTHLKRSNLTQDPEGHVILIARCMEGKNWQNSRKPPQKFNQEDT